jgi:hypothetical protein
MRLIYNRDYLFKGVPKNKHEAYFKRLLEFARDVTVEKDILSQYIIKKYNIKKMKGTAGIFKFVLLALDSSRCLIKYEEQDRQIFENEPGIVLLRIASHDEQGEIGRQIDKAFIDFQEFIEFDDAIGDDSTINSTLGREYMRTIYICPEITEEDFLKLLLDEDSKFVYKPSEKQYEALEAQGPILLLGCAGSGKTLVEISKAIKNVHGNINQGYFTFTSQLKDSAEKIYNKYTGSPNIKGKTTFYALRDFALDRLGFGLKNYMGYARYKDWLVESRIKERFSWFKDIGSVNLWIEIRGLIKGYMGNDFFRNLEIVNAPKLFNSRHLKYLSSNGIIEQSKKDSSTYIIMKSDALHKYIHEYPELRNAMFHNDFDSELLDMYTYLNLKDDYSRFNKESRRQIYEFVKNVYQKYLSDNQLYDDNDLSRLNIIRTYSEINKVFDYILVDEVQDLSEMQIYMLMDLARTPQSVFLTGDVSQVINPTFFQKGRSGLMFRNRKSIPWDKSNVLTLNENYRNGKNIVEVAKKIVEIRQDILGKYTEDIIEISKELETTEGLPVFVDVAQENFLEVMRLWLDAARVAIIVSGEDEKTELIKKLNIKRSEALNIFTVQEAKGQEFDKIIIYNVLSDYKEAWEKIMSSSKKNSTVHFQYYFNLLYVAVTRAKRNLFLYEDQKKMEILDRLVPLFEVVNTNLIEIMDPSEYLSEDMILKQAEQYFESEDYERSRLYYLKLHKKKEAAICKGYSFIQRGRFEQAVRSLYRFKEHHNTAFKISDTQETLLFHMLLGYRLKKYSIDQISNMLQRKSFVELLQPYRNDGNYEGLLIDTIQLMTAVNQYRIVSKIGRIES